MNGDWRSHLARIGRRTRRTPALVVHILLGVLIAAALGPGRERRYQSTGPLVWWSRRLCRILGVRMQIQGNPYQGAALFVANHISWLDIFCIAAVCPTHFLAKQAVEAWPLFGWLCRRAGTAFIQRGAAGGAAAATEQLLWRLRQGECITVFPEGTSTNGETVRRFHPRLFQSALLARCPVQAIALRYPDRTGTNRIVPFIGEDTLLPHLWRLLGESAIEVKLHFGSVRVPPHSSRDALAQYTQQEIRQLLSPTLVDAVQAG